MIALKINAEQLSKLLKICHEFLPKYDEMAHYNDGMIKVYEKRSINT